VANYGNAMQPGRNLNKRRPAFRPAQWCRVRNVPVPSGKRSAPRPNSRPTSNFAASDMAALRAPAGSIVSPSPPTTHDIAADHTRKLVHSRSSRKFATCGSSPHLLAITTLSGHRLSRDVARNLRKSRDAPQVVGAVVGAPASGQRMAAGEPSPHHDIAPGGDERRPVTPETVVVTQIFSSWNRIEDWLRQFDALQQAA
jgi:hypothetical protein